MQQLSITGLCIPVSRYCSLPAAMLHYSFIKLKLAKGRLGVFPGNQFPGLKNFWEAKILRRLVSVLVRSPYRKEVLELVNVNIELPPGGCIILSCHTPWKRLLVQWCVERNFAMIIAQGKWKNKSGLIQTECRGAHEIRKLVNFLKNNGRVIVALDVFNHKSDCPVNFRNKPCNASTVPVRLAKLAGVPLITVFPVYSNGAIRFIEGINFNDSILNSDPALVIQDLIDDLKKMMQQDPLICV